MKLLNNLNDKFKRRLLSFLFMKDAVCEIKDEELNSTTNPPYVTGDERWRRKPSIFLPNNHRRAFPQPLLTFDPPLRLADAMSKC